MWRMDMGHSSRLLTSLLTLAYYLPYHFCQLFKNRQYSQRMIFHQQQKHLVMHYRITNAE